MVDRPRTKRGDGVTMAPGASPGKALVWLAGAVGLACLALLVLFGRPERAPKAPRPPEASAPAGASAREETAREAEAEPRTPSPPPAPPSDVVAPEPAAEPAAAGPEGAPPPTVPSGIGLFPPPGTDPVKIGLVVPDDFELPEGFLRHYQVTDDGQELLPILLFHPDYELLGPDGEPLPLPADRVVPPELAPAGMPQELLVLPEPRDEEGR